mmetsp:Transcript_41478/g.72844  ORF Transcript_41478/g.72844 Transcript_41478/m.72844 type:complete len:358 (-) Transcript_41478:12-1085(-)
MRRVAVLGICFLSRSALSEAECDGVKTSCRHSGSDEIMSLLQTTLQTKVTTQKSPNAPSALLGALSSGIETFRGMLGIGRETLVREAKCRRAAEHDAVILYLVPARVNFPQDWADALHSLHTLRGLNDSNRAEVRLFVDRDDPVSHADAQELLDAAAPRDACVVPISFRQFPAGISEHSANPWSKRGWGYEHMIRFFFDDLFEKSLLDGFKYWMRMDTDSCLKSTITIDPFGQLDKTEELAYLHNEKGMDCGPVVQGLHDFASRYARLHDKPEPEALRGKPIACVGTYGNNIEIGRISAFQSKDVREFQAAVRSSEGIYRHRWGDAALRRLAIHIAGLKSEPLPSELQSLNQHPCHA